MSLTVYNLNGSGNSGHDGFLTAFIPVSAWRLHVRPSLSCRFLASDDSSDDFSMTDVGLDLDWEATDSTSSHVGVSHDFADAADRTLLRFGLDYRW